MKRLTAIALVFMILGGCTSNTHLRLPHYDPESSLPHLYENRQMFIYPPRSARAQLVEFDSAAQSLIAAPDTAVRRFFRDHRDDFSTSTVDGAEAYEKALRTILPGIVNRIRNHDYIRKWIKGMVEGVSDIKDSTTNDGSHFPTDNARAAFIDAFVQYLEYKNYTQGRLTNPESLVDTFYGAIYVKSDKDGKPLLQTEDGLWLLPFLQHRGNLKPSTPGRLWDVIRVGLRNREYLSSAIRESVAQRPELFATGRSETFVGEFYQAFQGHSDELVAEEIGQAAAYDYWWLTLYPKVIPAHQRVKATTTVTLDFGRRLVPEDEYRRWLLDHKVPPASRMKRALEEMILIEPLLPSDDPDVSTSIVQWLDDKKRWLEKAMAGKPPSETAALDTWINGEVASLTTEINSLGAVAQSAPYQFALNLLSHIATRTLRQQTPVPQDAWRWSRVRKAATLLLLKDVETARATTADRVNYLLRCYVGCQRSSIVLEPFRRRGIPVASLDDAITALRTRPVAVAGHPFAVSLGLTQVNLDANVFLTKVEDLIDDQFIALYPEVPSPEDLQEGIMDLPGATQSLVNLFFHDELVRLEERLPAGSALTAERLSQCPDLECIRRDPEIVGYAPVLRQTLLDIFARFPALEEEVREEIERGLIQAVAVRASLQTDAPANATDIAKGKAVEQRILLSFTSFLSVPSVHEALRSYMVRIYFRDLWNALFRYSDIEQAMDYRDIADDSTVYNAFLNDARVHVQEGLQIQEMLPLSKDELVAKSVSSGGLAAKVTAKGAFAASAAAESSGGSTSTRTRSSASPAVLEGAQEAPFDLPASAETITLSTSAGDADPLTISFVAGKPARVRLPAGPYDLTGKAGFQCAVGTKPATPIDLTTQGAQLRVEVKPVAVDDTIRKAQLQLRICNMDDDCKDSNVPDAGLLVKVPMKALGTKADIGALQSILEGGAKSCNACYGVTREGDETLVVTSKARGSGARIAMVEDPNVEKVLTPKEVKHTHVLEEAYAQGRNGSGPVFDASQAQASEIKDLLTKRLGTGVKVEADAGGGLVLETVATGAGATLTLRPPAEGDSALASIGLNTGTYKGSGGFRDPHAASAQETATYLDRLTSSRGVHVSAKGRGLVFQTDARGSAAYLKISGDPAVRIGFTPDQEAKGQATRREGNTVTSFQSGVTQAASFSAAASGNVTGGLLARMQHAYVYSQQKEYLNAIVTAAGRGSTTARWIIWPGPSSLAGSSKGRYQGYPNGDQPFYVLLRVPRKAVHRAWDGSQYIYFNSGFGMEKKGGQSAVVRFPFMYQVTDADDRASTQARLANVLGGRIRLDTTDKIPYSTILKMVNDEQTFIETARTTQSAALETASTTIQGDIPSQVEKPTAPPSQPQ